MSRPLNALAGTAQATARWLLSFTCYLSLRPSTITGVYTAEYACLLVASADPSADVADPGPFQPQLSQREPFTLVRNLRSLKPT